MAIFNDPIALARAQERRRQIFRQQIRIEHKSLADDLAKEASLRVSGNVKTAQLKAMGHPFSRRRARGFKGGAKARVAASGVPLLPINRQTGRLRSSLRLTPESNPKGQTYRLHFGARHAVFVLALGGTKKMLARGFWPHMRKAWRARNRRLIYTMRLRQLQLMYRKVA